MHRPTATVSNAANSISPSSTFLPLTLSAAAKRAALALPDCMDQSLKSTILVEMPSSHQLALTAGIRAAPRSSCILVAHWLRITTAKFRVAANFCSAPIKCWIVCCRFAEEEGTGSTSHQYHNTDLVRAPTCSSKLLGLQL